MTEKGLEQDGILYIGYADQDPFGWFFLCNWNLKIKG